MTQSAVSVTCGAMCGMQHNAGGNTDGFTESGSQKKESWSKDRHFKSDNQSSSVCMYEYM